MATIKNTLALQNKMTPVLNSVVKSLESTIDAMQRTGNASDAAFSNARADIAEARRAVETMNDSLRETKEPIKKVNEGFTVMKGILANIGSRIIQNIVLGLKRAAFAGVEYASDLLEVQNVIDKTYGKSASVIDNWSETALDAYGINTLSAKRYVGTMGAMLKASKVSGDQLAIMSTTLTGLAGDIASFYNISADEAFSKIQSGMAGMVRPLRDIGINMSVANLEFFAMSQGIETSFDKMDEASKAMLRYNYLLSLTGDVQGDFTDTAANFANQQRLMSENWLDFTGLMANGVLPMLTFVITALNKGIVAMKPYAPVIMTVVAALGAAAAAVGIYAAAQWLLNLAVWGFPGTWIVAAIVALIVVIAAVIGWIAKLWKENMDFRIGVVSIWNDILGFFDKIPLFFTKIGHGIVDVFEWVNTGVILIMQDLVNGAIDILNDFINALNAVPGVSIDLIGKTSFGTQEALQAEARKQARDASYAEMAAKVDAKAAGRETDLASYIAEQNAIEEGKKRQANEEAKQAAALQSMAEDGVEISGGTLDGIEGDVSISEEDIRLLKDVAATEFVNQYTTLRPELKVEIAEVKETVDIDVVMTKLEDMVEEAYGSALEEAG